MTSDPDAAGGPSIDPSESVIGRAIERTSDRLSRAAADSILLGAGRRVADRSVALAVDSTLADCGRFLASATRRSWLFRWLTAEPDPEVIVIDLRKTWTVGPVVRLLDYILDRLAGATADSRFVSAAQVVLDEFRAAPLRVIGLIAIAVGISATIAASIADGTATIGIRTVLGLAVTAVGALALRDDRTWAELRETRAVELLVAALEPPEPPESADVPGPSESNGSMTVNGRSEADADAESDA